MRDYSALLPRSSLYPVLAGRGVVVGSQAWRRSTILAVARELVAETGTEGVQIRPLAKRSGVTPPTIYSLVGRRTHVLQRAIGEALDAKCGLALHHAEMENVNPVLAYAEAVSISIARDPEYYRQVTAAALQPGVGVTLLPMIAARKSAAFGAWLETMRRDGLLRERCCDLASVANIVARQQCLTVIAWARCAGGFDQLRADLVTGTALVLLGIAGPEETARIEARLAYWTAAVPGLPAVQARAGSGPASAA